MPLSPLLPLLFPWLVLVAGQDGRRLARAVDAQLSRVGGGNLQSQPISVPQIALSLTAPVETLHCFFYSHCRACCRLSRCRR
uniref:Putative secreted protein n=1 Tax=Ixodes ricinus TaxID=34613 RepID=A0A6B0U7T7_IXORI